MARTRIGWTERAEESRKQIREWIEKDAPRTAAAFEKRLMARINRLRRFPYMGSVLEEFADLGIHEFYFKSYRIVYRVNLPVIEILLVQHGSKPLKFRDLELE
jgi:toxin ParE1/3/4